MGTLLNLPAVWRLACWDPASQPLVCVAVEPEAADCTTYRFRAEDERPGLRSWFCYRPGQSVTLRLPLPGGPLRAAFPLSSSPSRPYELAITVDETRGGQVAAWLRANLAPGQSLMAEGPWGDFTLLPPPADRYLFLSSGAGIAPLMSITRWLADESGELDIAFVHVAPTLSQVPFRQELESLAARHAWLNLVLLVEPTVPGAAGGGLTPGVLEMAVPRLAERVVLCSGEGGFLQQARILLATLGHDRRLYREQDVAPDSGVARIAGLQRCLTERPPRVVARRRRAAAS